MAIEDDMNFVFNKIREIRIEKKISQLELANIANFSQSFLANVESGKKKPSLLTILRIAEALNVNPREFFPKSTTNSKEELKTHLRDLIDQL